MATKLQIWIQKISLALILFTIGVLAVGDFGTRFRFDPSFIPIASSFNDFVTTFRSIIIQALPFITLGTVISVAVAIFLSENLILKIIPKNKVLSHITLASLGIFMPVCECGNIPVAKRLIMKGLSVSQSMTFLLAAPIINPVTIIATYEAFRNVYSSDLLMPGLRVVIGFAIAVTIGILLSMRRNQYSMLTDSFYREVCEVPEHEEKTSIKRAFDLFQKEFIAIGLSLVIGAIIASLVQTFVPRSFLLNIGLGIAIIFIFLVLAYFAYIKAKHKLMRTLIAMGILVGVTINLILPQTVILQLEATTLFSILAMITISLVISVCSSVDAFIAVGYASTFPAGSLLAFMTFGPMVDIKLLTIMRTSFRAEMLWFISIIVTLFSIIAGLALNLLM